MCVEIYPRESPSSCSFMYLWNTVILIQSPVKEIFHFKWELIGTVVGFFILPTAGYESLTLFLYVSLKCSFKKTVSKMCLFKKGQYCHALLSSPQEEAFEYLLEGLWI